MRTAIAIDRLILAIAVAAVLPSFAMSQTIDVRVSANNDDAEELSSNGAMYLDSSDLELAVDSGTSDTVGIRFAAIAVPRGAAITGAYIQFKTDETGSTSTSLTIRGQAIDDAPGFTTTNYNITSRTTTTASVTWSPPAWNTVGEAAAGQRTPDISSIIQEIIGRPGWSSGNDLVVIINGTGTRTAESYEGDASGAALLHVEYTAAPPPTPASDRLYVERFAAWNATSAATWQTITLSGPPYNVPANKVVEIAIANSDPSNERWGGVRGVGSSLDRRLLLHEAESGGVDVVVMQVQTDASSRIQLYASSTSLVTFGLLGYWSSGSYTERMQSFTVSSSGTWLDRNLGPYGVGANQIAEVVMTNSNTSNERAAGVRRKGSSLARTVTLHEAQDGGIDAATLFVQASKSSDAVIQAYASVSADVTFYLVGYWSLPPGKFTETSSNVGVPTSSNVWQDKNLSSYGVPGKAVAEILLVNTEAGAENSLGVRENSSTNDRRILLHQAKDGGGDLARTHATADAGAIIEWYSTDVGTADMDVFLTGYWQPAAGNVLMVVADEQTPSAQALARLTLLEGWGFVANLIDDDDAQADYDAALPYNNLVYVPQEANAAVGGKVGSGSLGIVSEHAGLVDDLGFSAASTATTGTNLFLADATHYITSAFSAGQLTIFTSSQPVTSLSGQESSHLQAPGEWDTAPALATLEAGARMYSSNRTNGRRVQLPWGGAGFDIAALNSNGRTILQRSLQWASALKGYWKFDETAGAAAADSSGHRNNATLATGFTFDSSGVPSARIYGGLAFNGAGNYVSASTSASLEVGAAITLSAWIKPNAVSTCYLFDKDSQSSYYLKINANGSLTLGSATSGWQVTSPGVAVVGGVWQHVAGTYDSATGTGVLYVNGLAVRTQTGLSGTIGISGASLVLGANNAGDADFFAGELDDLRVYDHALAQSEVTALKRTGEPRGVRIVQWVELP